MNINAVGLHTDYPEKVWVIVEQPRNEPYRFSYDPISQTFYPTARKSLGYERGGGSSVYGWIGGTGIPPQPHHDVILVTRGSPPCGTVLLGYICGVFLRHDNDHKFIAADDEIRRTMAKMDLESLGETVFQELRRLYPRVGEGEGWFGADVAYTCLRNKPIAT
jgi:hypothetical protein